MHKIRSLIHILTVSVVGFGSVCLFSQAVFAKARPWHQHEDLFSEDDIMIGFKAGPQINGYTPMKIGITELSAQSTIRFVAGATFKFVYGLPRFEFDIFWNARGGFNSADTLHSFSFPILVKIPLEIDENTDIEFGAGYQFDKVFLAVDTHRSMFQGVVGSIGLSKDYKDFAIEFELRYVVGLYNLDESYVGAYPRDFEILPGLSWHF